MSAPRVHCAMFMPPSQKPQPLPFMRCRKPQAPQRTEIPHAVFHSSWLPSFHIIWPIPPSSPPISIHIFVSCIRPSSLPGGVRWFATMEAGLQYCEDQFLAVAVHYRLCRPTPQCVSLAEVSLHPPLPFTPRSPAAAAMYVWSWCKWCKTAGLCSLAALHLHHHYYSGPAGSMGAVWGQP